MNTISMKVLQEALAALSVARKLALDTPAGFPFYQQVMYAEVNLQIALESMEAVEVAA